MEQPDTRPLVLTIDDNPTNLKVLGGMLSKGGYRVAVAVNGFQALEYVSRKTPDLILLDVMMPDMDGFEVCAQIRARGNALEVPILFVTALGDLESRLKGFEAGGDDYITKPYSREEVMARVRVFIERRMAVKALETMNLTLEERVRERTDHIQKMQSRLMVQEKMAAMGQLAAGIAHELNNPLNFVHTNFAALKENVADMTALISGYRKFLDHPDDAARTAIRGLESEVNVDFILSDLPTLFEESEKGFERMIWIINCMRNFSRRDDPGVRQDLDLNNAIRETITIARGELKHHCEVITDLGDIPLLSCVPQQINEVLLNLVVNAAQAIRDQQQKAPGHIHIRTYLENNLICCEVRDDGPGIPPDIQKRIFDPFFTTKPTGKGTGLGLSISYDIIVDKHGGHLTVESREGEGAMFRIMLAPS